MKIFNPFKKNLCYCINCGRLLAPKRGSYACVYRYCVRFGIVTIVVRATPLQVGTRLDIRRNVQQDETIL